MDVSFTLWLTSSPSISLLRTHFIHKPMGISAISIRGKNLGGFGNFGSHQWTKGVWGLVHLCLRTAFDAKQPPSLLLTGAAITGGKGSSAAALDAAITCQKQWVRDMFGEVEGCRPITHRLFARSNPGLRIGPELGIEFNGRILKGENIIVCCDGVIADTAQAIGSILTSFENQLRGQSEKRISPSPHSA